MKSKLQVLFQHYNVLLKSDYASFSYKSSYQNQTVLLNLSSLYSIIKQNIIYVVLSATLDILWENSNEGILMITFSLKWFLESVTLQITKHCTATHFYNISIQSAIYRFIATTYYLKYNQPSLFEECEIIKYVINMNIEYT